MSEAPSTTSISAAAQAYQLAMAQQAAPPTPPARAEPSVYVDTPQDTLMHETLIEANLIPTPVPTSMTPAPILPPPRTGTPARLANGGEATSSRATSQLPEPSFAMPAEAPPHGAPVRQYLNSKVTGALLEGMKQLAKDRPKDPLRVLGEFLLQRSRETEGK